VLPTGELLYFVAAVAVLYDRDEDSQRHYIGHTEDIQWYIDIVVRKIGIRVSFIVVVQYGRTSFQRDGGFGSKSRPDA